MIVNWEISTVNRFLKEAGIEQTAMELINSGELKSYQPSDQIFVWSNDLLDFLNSWKSRELQAA